jgi:hypothetical protein
VYQVYLQIQAFSGCFLKVFSGGMVAESGGFFVDLEAFLDDNTVFWQP